MKDLVFVDVETTGLAPESRVIEFAVYRTKPSEVFRFFENEIRSWKIMPPEGCYIELKAIEINGFSRELWEGALPFWQLSSEFTEYLHDAIVAGWNVSFDIMMLENEYRRFDTNRMPWYYHSFDVASLMLPLYLRGEVKSLSLRNACDYFRVSNRGAHSAKGDVMRMVEVFYNMRKIYDLPHCDGELI